MQVTVTGGVGNSPATLRYDANDLAAINAQALAATIDTNYQTAIYYNPHHPPKTPSAGYLIVSKSVASNTIDARGFGAIVDEDNGRASTIIGGGSDVGQIVIAGDGGLTYSAHNGGATVAAGGGENLIKSLRVHPPRLAGVSLDQGDPSAVQERTLRSGDGQSAARRGIGDLDQARATRLKADRDASMSDRLARVHVLSKQMSAIKGAATDLRSSSTPDRADLTDFLET